MKLVQIDNDHKKTVPHKSVIIRHDFDNFNSGEHRSVNKHHVRIDLKIFLTVTRKLKKGQHRSVIVNINLITFSYICFFTEIEHKN